MAIAEETHDAPAWTEAGSKPHLIGYPDKRDQAYLPSWSLGVADPRELEAIPERVADIEGKLYDEDAMKLYELASFSPASILEIGVFRGRSTTVMARALAAARNPAQILSVDIDAHGLEQAARNLARHGVAQRVTLVEGTAGSLLKRTPRFRPGLVFVDGDHSLKGASDDLRAIEPITPAGAIIVMHDFEGYADSDPYWIQVESAVRDSWLATDARYLGRFGLSGVFLRISGGPPLPQAASLEPVLVELERGSSPTVSVRRRVARAVDYRLWSVRNRR